MPALPHGAESRESAPRAVCASFAIPFVAMCLPSGASPMSIASSRINLLASMGVRSVLLALREHDATGRDFARACHEATVAHEARTKAPVNAIFVQTSPDLLWTQPLWPYCFYKWDGSRSHGHFHWYSRADADTLLLAPDARHGVSSHVDSRARSTRAARVAARPVSVLEDPLLAVALPLPPSETECRAFQNATPAHALKLGCPPRRLSRRLSPDGNNGHAGQHAEQRQRRDGPRNGSRAGSRVVSAKGMSPFAVKVPFLYTTSTTSNQEVNQKVNGTEVGTDAASCQAMARAVCTTLEGVHSRVPRLALGLGGLARTFAHQLVYQTVRGHLIDAVGARTTVFAHLRLEDDRPVLLHRTNQAPPTMTSPTRPTPTVAAEQQHHMHSLKFTASNSQHSLKFTELTLRRVVVALEALGTAPENVELVGSDGMLMNFDGSIRGPATAAVDAIRRVPDCDYIRHPRVPPRSPCDTYLNVCALPTALGQVMGPLMASDGLT